MARARGINSKIRCRILWRSRGSPPPSRPWLPPKRGGHLLYKRVEQAAGRGDDQLAADLRTDAFDAVRHTAWHEHHFTGAELELDVAKLALVVPRADDVGFVIRRMAVQPGGSVRRLDRFAQREGAAGVGGSRLEGQRDAAELVGLALFAPKCLASPAMIAPMHREWDYAGAFSRRCGKRSLSSEPW
jgi:hypothetical protein